MKNYYDVLGINIVANAHEIKKAYRKKALKYHPDINTSTDAQERFIEINEAYEILIDNNKRAAYDNLFNAYKENCTNTSANTNVKEEWRRYREWQDDGMKKGVNYSKMSFLEFKYKVLDHLVYMYDWTKLVVKIIVAITVLSYFLYVLSKC